MRIKAVVILKAGDLHKPTGQGVVVGELPGPWKTVESAVRDALLDGQRYRIHEGVVYAEEIA